MVEPTRDWRPALQRWTKVTSTPEHMTIAAVESGTLDRLYPRLPVIRVEAHLIRSQARQVFTYSRTKRWLGHAIKVDNEWVKYHGSQRGEHQALFRAMAYDVEDALQATSMGPFQILGRHYAKLGYDDALDMWLSLGTQSLATHLSVLLDFLEVEDLELPLMAHDWTTVASGYNGPGNVKVYSKRLADAYKQAVEMLDGRETS